MSNRDKRISDDDVFEPDLLLYPLKSGKIQEISFLLGSIKVNVVRLVSVLCIMQFYIILVPLGLKCYFLVSQQRCNHSTTSKLRSCDNIPCLKSSLMSPILMKRAHLM